MNSRPAKGIIVRTKALSLKKKTGENKEEEDEGEEEEEKSGNRQEFSVSAGVRQMSQA